MNLIILAGMPATGKSTVAANLAVSMARKDKDVILIDCDIRNPSSEESAKAMARIAGRQLQLTAEERSKFEDLYLTILRNRKILGSDDRLRSNDQ